MRDDGGTWVTWIRLIRVARIGFRVSLVLEYESVLLRHGSASPLTGKDMQDLVDYICEVAVGQEIFFLWRPVLRVRATICCSNWQLPQAVMRS